MRLEIIFFFYKCLIIYNKYRYVHAKALSGENVQQAQEGEYKFVVAVAQIQNENPYQFFKLCGGALVTRSDVVTAEHCVSGRNLSRVEVIAGSVNITQGTNYNLYWWLIYSQWMQQNGRQIEFEKNDIVVLRLRRNVPSSISPASLSYVANTFYYGLEVSVASWTRRSSGELSVIMEKGTVVVIPHNDCNRRITLIGREELRIPERYLCTAAHPYLHLDKGDSGGPLLFHTVLIGINGGTCPSVNSTRVVNLHVGVAYYRQYIIDIMNNY